MSSGTLEARPEVLRRRCLIAAGFVFVLFTVAAVALTVGSGHRTYGVADQVSVFVIGLGLAWALTLPGQSRLRADARTLWVRNILARHDVPWDLVAAVRFDDSSAWAALELVDGDVLAVMALRASDGERAVEGVRTLRALHAIAAPRRAG